MPSRDLSEHAAVRAYHQRSKHRFEGYAAGPETLDWDAQPAPFRHFEGAPAIRLPLLADVPAGNALHQALQRPFVTLDAAGAMVLPADLYGIGALLQLSLGVTAWKSLGPDRWAVRANPSSGNLHPTEAYLLVAGIEGLENGLYHYRPEDHALELRARHAVEASTPRLAITLTSVIWREAWKYGERAFRYGQLDIGHAVGTLRYAAAVLGWRLQEQAQVGSATLARLAGVDRLEEFPAQRLPDTEREEAEILLAVGFSGAAPAPLAVTELRTLAQAARWYGVASCIDRHPLYRWPIIAEIAAATRREDAPVVSCKPPPLPSPAQPRAQIGAIAVAELLSNRRSAQRFDRSHSMSLACFAALLARLRPTHNLPWDVFDDSPRLALVLFVNRVEGLTPGLYLLPRTDALLTRLKPRLAKHLLFEPVPGVEGLLRLTEMEPVALRRISRSLHCHQDIAANACFALGMLAEFDETLQRQGPAAYRGLHREAGLIGQVLYLEAEAHGLRGTGIGCFFDDPVHELLGLQGDAWQSLYHFTVGLPVPDPRIESAPAYARRDTPEPTGGRHP
ncbi:SagB/ThcOx family dehydrogenase [Pseudomonas lopnurensis]|uniref:SagB/ThcOx family dehydrogenase n=1 Tax=Pseudomonas lopnurensis TaxID=1477517 RepID=UPI0028A601E1|nr:SagB/ThcOx family dehydrogenase [Pseudomonas lopnurensis]